MGGLFVYLYVRLPPHHIPNTTLPLLVEVLSWLRAIY